jgi:hypothetical protein
MEGGGSISTTVKKEKRKLLPGTLFLYALHSCCNKKVGGGGKGTPVPMGEIRGNT